MDVKKENLKYCPYCGGKSLTTPYPMLPEVFRCGLCLKNSIIKPRRKLSDTRCVCSGNKTCDFCYAKAGGVLK